MSALTSLTSAHAFAPRPSDFSGFVRAQGRELVDGTGRPLLLRGVGLGNWLLPEGYMWKFGSDSPRSIEALTVRLMGAEASARFWQRWYEEFIGEDDIALIAASGFDHVRLPINARVVQDEDGEPIEAGFAIVDRLIERCRAHGLRVLLDLHGAPGGQTGTNIDDSPNGDPELFIDPERYRPLALRLWRDIATRYRDDTAVLGYDLLNEPLPNEWSERYASDLAVFYREVTAQIRAIDPNHLIMYEGTKWATDWGLFDARWDDNSCLQFHKYWSAPEQESIQPYLDARERLDVPIYMGEGGENTTNWIYTAFRMYEDFGIGWNFWPWKKMVTLTSPLSIPAPEGWDAVTRAAAGEEIELSQADAERIFTEMLDSAAPARSEWQPDIVAAMTAVAPAFIPAWGYGYRGAGVSFQVASPASSPRFRPADGVPIVWLHEGEHPENPFDHAGGRPRSPEAQLGVALEAGDRLAFTVTGAGASDYLPVGADGEAVDAEVSATEDGLLVTARSALLLAGLTLTQKA